MNNTTSVSGNELNIGDTIYVQGYDWVIDVIHAPTIADNRWGFKCHWSGQGVNPCFHNDDFSTAQRADLKWVRKG